MISKVLLALEKGLLVMRSNSRMLFVGILVFVFPVLFVWITQSFFTTAYNNITTADDHRLANIHTALSTALLHKEDSDLVDDMVKNLLKTNGDDLRAIRVLIADEEGYLIKYAEEENLVGTYNPPNRLLTDVGFTDKRTFIRNDFTVNGHRVWQAFTQVPTDNGFIYIFTEQNFQRIDDLMTARRQQSYFGLTGIFIFLMSLAYWLNRQVDWQKKHTQLSAQMEERDLFSNMIAHEFRAPLTAIKGYASFILEADGLKPEEKRYAEIISSSSERLVKLVSDFLEVARLQSGKMKLKNTTFDVREVLIAVQQDLREMAKDKDLNLSYEPGNKKIFITTDQNRLTQVLVNMVTNAIKYTKEGSVTLSSELKSNKIIIRIMDTGMGISSEDQKKLFTPFERVGGVDKTETTGTGLGMYITKKLVTFLGGTIGIESIEGVGSHIVLTLKAD